MTTTTNNKALPLRDEDFAYLLQEGLTYLSQGWSLFPMAGGTPLCRWLSLQKRRMTDKRFCKLMRKYRDEVTGVGVICGHVSARQQQALTGRQGVYLAVRIFTQKRSFEKWSAQYPNLAATLPSVSTGTGKHVFCYTTDDPSISLVFDDEDGELRASSNTYVTLPPSPGYAWDTGRPMPSNFPIKTIAAFGFDVNYSHTVA